MKQILVAVSAGQEWIEIVEAGAGSPTGERPAGTTQSAAASRRM